MKRIFAIASIAVLAITAASCGKSGNTAPAGSDTSTTESTVTSNAGEAKNDNLTHITFALDWTPNTNHTGLYVADELGYFEEAGLDVEFVQASSGYGSELVGVGQAEFGIDFQDSLAYTFASDNPIPVTAVAAIIQHNTGGIITRADSNVQSPKDLMGLHYATWDDPMEQAVMKYCVENDGGDFSKVICDPVSVDDAIAGLNSGLDAIWVYYGWDGIRCKLDESTETNFFYFRDYLPEFDEYSPVLIANNDFIEENPEAAKAFVSAVKKGYEYAIDQPAKAADLLCKAVPELDPALVGASQAYISEEYRSDADTWGVIDADRWNRVYDWMYDQGILEKEIEDNFGFTNDYLQ